MPSTELAAPSTAVPTDGFFPASFRPQINDLATILRTVQVMEQRNPAPGDSTPSVPSLSCVVTWTAPVMGTPGSVLLLTLLPSVFDPNMSTIGSLLEILGLPRQGILSPPYPQPLKRDSPKSEHGPTVLLSTLLPQPSLCNGYSCDSVEHERFFRTKYQHFLLLLSHTNSVVTCLQECHMPLPLPSPPRGFQMYHRAEEPGQVGLDHGGVCILVRGLVGHALLPLWTPLQDVAVRCYLGCHYTICSLCIPPNTPVTCPIA